MKPLAKEINVNLTAQPITKTGVTVHPLSGLNQLSPSQTGGKMSLLAKDIEIAHRRRWPSCPMSLASCILLLASSPGLQLMLMYRTGYWSYLKRKNGGWRAWFWRITVIPLAPLRLAIKIRSKSFIRHDIEIENGVCFSDQGHIIFGARKTGSGTVIGERVTIGEGSFNAEIPEIGRNVWIGSDCVAYGNIRIGDGATLLPGTVLTRSVPDCAVMQGNPARLMLRNFDNSELRKNPSLDAVQYVTEKRGG